MDKRETYQISIVIVNYNVQYFLDQCLDSVRKASTNVSSEVFVVDNCSIDGSIEMVKEKYPEVKLIENKDNVGFSKANNQAMRIAQGKYILLLNPDTVVSEDTFERVIEFMDNHDEAGGLGIHMIDGKGKFLPESKRGLPTPIVAFYKIFGLSNLFPKSKRFGQYHLGHLSKEENHEIDILSGAFMLMRKTALEKVGLLDEDFFMYGEDIDLSYRIQLGGYKNYYFAESSIIHYKGESTKKSSVNYVFVFYNAMIIFAKKHFSGQQAKLFSFAINLAIYLRAGLAITTRFIKAIFLPFIDFIYITIGLFALTNYWKQAQIEFPDDLIAYSIPIYAVTWITLSYFNGAYDFPVRIFKYLKGVAWGTILILIAYAILPKSWQFSRLFIFIGAGWVFIHFLISRVFLHFAIGRKFDLTKDKFKRFTIVGDLNEYERVKQLIEQTNDKVKQIVRKESLVDIPAKNSKLDEVVFCSKSMNYTSMIKFMTSHANEGLDFKIAPDQANYIIGSNSIDTAGDLYILNINTLTSPENKRKKRLFDITFSIALVLLTPIWIFTIKSKSTAYRNILKVLKGKLTFVGYKEEDMTKDVRLPRTKTGLFSPADIIDIQDDGMREKLNLLYARDYSIRKDISILLKAWRKLDR